MSGFFSSKYLRYREITGEAAPLIDKDILCRACGYNLRGLRPGGRCPECGHFGDPGDAPQGSLIPDDPSGRAVVARGLFLVWTCMLVTVGLRVAALASVFGNGLRLSRYALVMILVATVWAIGVWWSTPAGLDRISPLLARERRLVRWGALAMIPGYVLLLIAINQGALTAEVTSLCLRLVGGAAALLHLHVLSVGAWHSDFSEESERLYNLAFWTAIGSIMVMLAPISGPWIFYIWVAGVIVLWAIAVVRTALVVRTLAHFLRHYSREIAQAGTRLDRIQATREAIDREVEQSIRPYRS